ncbi:MAG: hypothetical protein L6R42_004505 [Xanthoria sp. 1 TBL-2021]|nr:MAG: hypothetical protein L6R42_004505 [Xanthoria sp. 1 TBL-2021]
MVTGVETAGLVLASLPIVVQVLTEYRSGLRKTLFLVRKSKTYETKIGKLARQLKVLHTNLLQVLTRFIGAAAPDDWCGEVLKDYRSQIWTGEVGKKIRTYLEEVDAFDTFETIIEDFEDYLVRVAKSLSGLLPTPAANSRDLRALVDAHSKTGGHFRLQGRFEFLMRESQIVTIVDELKDLSVSLESLVDNSDSIHHMKQLKASSKQSEYAKTLYAVQWHAHCLFKALRLSWVQTCHPCHEALLRLEDRCVSGSSRIPSAAAGPQTPLTFTALFQKHIPRADLLLSWHQSEILFPISRATTQIDRHIQIEDMCRAILDIRPHILLVSADSRVFRADSQSTTVLAGAEKSHDTVRLERVLLQHPNFSPVDKFGFGLSIASSLLQLNLTPWICKCWTKDDILLRRERSADSGYDMAHPLIRGSFEELTTCQRSEDNPEVALVELGILLVEIWTEKTLEHWVENTGRAISDLSNLPLRRGLLYEWWSELKKKAPPSYCQVVQICFFPNEFGDVNMSWDDVQFKALYYTNIVEPLSKDLEQLLQMQ